MLWALTQCSTTKANNLLLLLLLNHLPKRRRWACSDAQIRNRVIWPKSRSTGEARQSGTSRSRRSRLHRLLLLVHRRHHQGRLYIRPRRWFRRRHLWLRVVLRRKRRHQSANPFFNQNKIRKMEMENEKWRLLTAVTNTRTHARTHVTSRHGWVGEWLHQQRYECTQGNKNIEQKKVKKETKKLSRLMWMAMRIKSVSSRLTAHQQRQRQLE